MLSIRGHAHILTMLLIFAALITGTISAYSKNNKASGPWTVGIFTAAAIAAVLFLVFDRNAYLPFLGPTVAPIAAFDPSYPSNATMKISVRPPAGSIRVLYWAAEVDALHPRQAYGAAVPNAGLASVSPRTGMASLRIAPPGQYAVGWKGVLPRHVHWRAVFPSGIMSEVYTTPIQCGCRKSSCPLCA